VRRVLAAAALVASGALALGAVDWTLEATSTNGFCYTCHSHATFIRPDYEASSHFANASGVRAGCADCHLPHDNVLETAGAKLAASVDAIAEWRGELATQEKYDGRRTELAEKVWREFEANDSRFCRSCHERDAMAATLQSPAASRMHARARETGRTCIACHKGIVHGLPAVHRDTGDA
jgi:nitrate/TMAO reductase-like tetraheme cytochrome c subunit